MLVVYLVLIVVVAVILEKQWLHSFLPIMPAMH